ncbi:MAG: carboxypeptidase regulatory-like domain-containing protein, partial [Flavobacteriales bacterium]|nr:carboxypeptidase regulatory-like domain-containing protein [Flavobacteriales bacterium]
DATGFDGNYALGTLAGGMYTVTASAPGYPSRTYTGIQLVNGELTMLDIELGIGAGITGNAAIASVMLSVFPNPGQGLFTVGNTGGAGAMRVLDLQGRTVLGPFNVAGKTQLDARKLPAGSYLVRQQCQNGELRTARLLKE